LITRFAPPKRLPPLSAKSAWSGPGKMPNLPLPVELTLEPPMQITAQQWIEHLALQARLEECGHLDLLVDATGLDCPVWASRHDLERPPAQCALLAGTPEHPLAEKGPILLRVDWADTAQCKWASHWLQAHHDKPRYLVIASHWPVENLAMHLAYFTQGVWDQGRKSGICRFYDPLLFNTFIEQLHPEQRKLLNAAIVNWWWLDRDGAMRQVPGDAQPLGRMAVPASPLTLDAYQMVALRAWSQAERWCRQRWLNPGAYGITRREALVYQVWMAHMAAHRQKPEEPLGELFVEQWLARNSEYTQRTGRVY